MEAPDYTIDDFREHMGPSQWMEPRIMDDFWVFSQEGEGGDLGFVTEKLANNNWEDVKEYLKSVLCDAENAEDSNVLFQFWVRTTSTTYSTTGGYRVFTTSNQPFGLHRIERGVCEYRKYCTTLEFNVFDDESSSIIGRNEDVFGSAIGRAFRDKKKEYISYGLSGDFAFKCRINGSHFFPLRSGVLEVSRTPKGSVKPIPKSFANERETVQNEVVREMDIDNGSNILGLEQNGMVVCHSEKTAGEELFVEAATNDETTTSLPPMPESLRNENEVVQQLSDDEPTVEEAVRNNELNDGIVKQTNAAVTSSEIIFSRAEASEREYRTANIAISREDLTKHFGKKLDDAARILKVSRSTMKRAMRHHDIAKWPVPKRKKVNALRVRTGNEGIEGTYKGDPSCSDPPPTSAAAGISHKTSNSTQEHDVGNVTVKATLGGDTIRFDLPFLSTKTDLVEEVTRRLRLNEGSFHIKYQDEENDWILIACDEDVVQCIDIWKGKDKIMKMRVQPITNQAP